MTTPPSPQIPQLPSRRVGAFLAALMLATGIAVGALIGPGPASSLASTSRAAALGRTLALLALGSATGSGSDLLLSAGAAHPQASASTPAPAPPNQAGAGSGSAGTPGAGAASSASSQPAPSPTAGSVSPTSSKQPATSSPGGSSKGEKNEKTKATAPLPPIASVWLVVLPYGGSIENMQKQSAAAPYLNGQLTTKGTVLSGYSSLAVGQLAGAATLLSGQVTASESVLAPPPCGTGAPAGAAAGTGADSTGTPSGSPAPAQGATGVPCPVGEPAGAQAADAFLQEVVAKIMASPSYGEHGLIAITFAAPGQGGTATGTTPAPATETAGSGVAYPTGSLTGTLTAAGPPAGALLLSPFLRHAGARSANVFDPTSPRKSIEALFQAKAPGG